MTWNTDMRPCKPRSRCSPKRRSVTRLAQQHLGRVPDEHLLSARDPHQPCRVVHFAAEVVPVVFDRFTGVQTHADHEVDDGLVAQLLLGFDRRGQPRRAAVENAAQKPSPPVPNT